MRACRIIAAGDIFLGPQAREGTLEALGRLRDPRSVVLVNLEMALTRRGRAAEKYVILSGPPERAALLKAAGVDIVNLANNHVLDLGSEGLADTLDALSSQGLPFVGAGRAAHGERYAIVVRDGMRIAVAGYHGYRRPAGPAPGADVYPLDPDAIRRDIGEMRRTCEAVVLSLHWGVEKVRYPSPEQIHLARGLIDAGATVVVGHHPHVAQGVERYSHGLIAYSLGNFCFPGATGEERESVVLSVELGSSGVASYELIPVQLDETSTPRLAEGDLKRGIRERMAAISEPIARNRITRRWWFEEAAGAYLADNWKAWLGRIRRSGLVPLLKCLKWAASPFVFRCYLGLLRKRLVGHEPRPV